MISKQDKNKILRLAQKYNVSEIILFGTAAYNNKFRDIDLAVKGLEPKMFFKFYGEMICHVSKPVDLINLDKKNSFVELVQKEGKKIYG